MNTLSSKRVLAQMFGEAAGYIRIHSEMLSKLDTVGGDGDHGATMTRVMEVVEQVIKLENSNDAREMLRHAGAAVLNVDGGASSAILGSFISGMSSVEIESELNTETLARVFSAGLHAVMRQTRAQVGDKTMMDALVPAVRAIEAAANSGMPVVRAMEMASDAARNGADSTEGMIAKYGRAKSLGERTRGSADPGATSIALLFRGFSAANVRA